MMPIPMRQQVYSNEVAEAVAWLCSDEPSYWRQWTNEIVGMWGTATNLT
jgi:hypothetical protein